jgi:CheY-like chemotaxis protein/HPt (histidine-containing phosphotransfer) domain-containing protein
MPVSQFRDANWFDDNYDAIYVLRGVRGTSAEAALEAHALDVLRPPIVIDRTPNGASWLAHATPVTTSAQTARSVVATVARATGRADLADGEEVAPLRSTHRLPDDAPLVLVAEDHPTNRIVIRRQLGMLGYRCLIAEDGIEALELLAEHDFALLLADCHMPRLDGYELTRQIRYSEAETGDHLPIVALTASALPSETERCLECGMDLVLTKPVDLEALDRALGQWLRPVESESEAVPVEPLVTRSKGGPSVDLSMLRELLGDDEAVIAEVLESFKVSAADSLAMLDQAVYENDSDEIRSAAHRLLGGARTVGATNLVRLCEIVEEANGAAEAEVLSGLRNETVTVLNELAAATAGDDVESHA